MDTNSGGFTVPVMINKNKITFIFTDNFRSNSQSNEVEKHCHSFYEIHYYIEGTGTMCIADSVLAFGPGSLLIISPETYHLQQSRDCSVILKYIFKFSISCVENRFDNILAPLLDILDSDHYLFVKNIPETREILEKIQEEIDRESKGYLLQISNHLSSMMILLARKYHFASTSNDSHISKQDKISTETAIIIDNFFDQNYSKNVKCDDLCDLVHLSQSQLSRILKSMYSMTFKEKHIQTRILYIQHLLSKPNASVTEIAYKSGFDSVSGFSNFFSRYAKISPAEYKKQNRTL